MSDEELAAQARHPSGSRTRENLDPQTCGFGWTNDEPHRALHVSDVDGVEHECIRVRGHERNGMHICSCGAVGHTTSTGR